MEPGLPIPVVITAFADKSFTFVMKTPPATVLIKKAARMERRLAKPHTDKVGKITRAQAEEIAKAKMPDLTAADMEAAVRTVAGSARSMGITWRVCNGTRIQAPQANRSKVEAQRHIRCDALALIKQSQPPSSMNPSTSSVELGIDAKKSDQTVRGSVVLPAGQR